MNKNEIEDISESYNKLKNVLNTKFIFSKAKLTRSTSYNISNSVFRVKTQYVKNIENAIDLAIRELLDIRDEIEALYDTLQHDRT